MTSEVTVTVTPEAREAYLAMNMLPEFDAVDVREGRWDKTTGLQAFARFERETIAHLAHRGGEVVAWQGIESAPMDEQILAAIKVHHKNGEIWWEQHIIVIDSETGEIRDMDFHHGWEAEDYEAWQPLPTPPQALGEQP